MTRARLALFLVVGGIYALTGIPGRQLPAQAEGIPVSTFLQADAAGTKDQKWNAITIELGPGVVDSRSVRPGTGLVYVLEGAGFLEAEGKPPVALNPGVVAALNPKQLHVLKNTSQTQTLKVLVVSRHQGGGEPIPNGDLRQQKTNEQDNSAHPGLVF